MPGQVADRPIWRAYPNLGVPVDRLVAGSRAPVQLHILWGHIVLLACAEQINSDTATYFRISISICTLEQRLSIS